MMQSPNQLVFGLYNNSSSTRSDKSERIDTVPFLAALIILLLEERNRYIKLSVVNYR